MANEGSPTTKYPGKGPLDGTDAPRSAVAAPRSYYVEVVGVDEHGMRVPIAPPVSKVDPQTGRA